MSVDDFFPKVILHIAKRIFSKREFNSLRVDDIVHDWEAFLPRGPPRVRKLISWAPSLEGVLKFNIDGATRDRLARQHLMVLVGCVQIAKGPFFFCFLSMQAFWDLMRQKCWLFWRRSDFCGFLSWQAHSKK